MAAVSALSMELAGCAVVKGIFKAGVWVGVLVVVGLFAIVAVALSMFRRV
jgi:hypothetical protein